MTTMTVLRQFLAGLRLLLVLTVLLGLAYPLLVLGIGQLAFHAGANGSLVTSHGAPVGSALLGQRFSGPQWFIPRPSAAGAGYDGLASGGSNLGPGSTTLQKSVDTARAAAAAADGVAPADVLPDAVTASASGLDPDISPAYAELQAPRVARERHTTLADVRTLIKQHTTGRALGVLGEPGVDVVDLNIALDRAYPKQGA